MAILLAFSRPYVGIHFPSDVIGGALIGMIFGYIFAFIVIKIDRFISMKQTKITEKYERVKFK